MRSVIAGIALLLGWGLGCGAAEPAASAPGLRPRRAVGVVDAPSPGSIRLADGQALRSLRALIRFQPDRQEAPHCALYGLEVEPTLREGRRALACEVADAFAEPLTWRAPEAQRAERLRRALEGASIEGEAQAEASNQAEHIRLWVQTDARVVDGEVAPARWPAPGIEAPAAHGRSPRGLTELWEAVMYPERYR